MKKLLLLVLPLLFFLSGCNETPKYNKTDTALDGNYVYYYETDAEVCIALYSTTIELTEDLNYEVFYNCNVHKVVLFEGEYIPITAYIRDNLESIDDLLNSDLGTPIYYDSIMSILDIDINDYELDKITIRTLNGVFNEYGGEWTESTDLVLYPDILNSHILDIMATKVSDDTVCDNNMCIIYGNISPGSVYLKNGDEQLRIDFFGNRYEIFYENNDETIRIYGITITSSNDSLSEEIMNLFNNKD